MHISEYIGKTCLKELGILLKFRKTFEKFIAAWKYWSSTISFYEISSTVIYISKDQKFIIHVFYWCIPLDHEIYTKCKKTSNLIKGMFSHNICSGIKSEHVYKPCVIKYQKRLIFLIIPLLHFIESLLTIPFYVCF